jgi:hypothetical protein
LIPRQDPTALPASVVMRLSDTKRTSLLIPELLQGTPHNDDQ